MSELVEVAGPVVATLASLALAAAAVRYVRTYRRAKQGFSQVVDVLTTIRDAWEDDRITEEEFSRIVTEAGKLADTIRE